MIVAIIGYGVVGKRRRKFIAKNKNYSLVAVSDIQFLQNTKRSTTTLFIISVLTYLKHL